MTIFREDKDIQCLDKGDGEGKGERVSKNPDLRKQDKSGEVANEGGIGRLR